MDVKYINLFLEAFIKTLNELGIADVKRGGIKKKSKFYVDLDVSAVISLKGSLQGNAVLSMSQDTAKKMASKMMGTNIAAVDDLAKSAIGELASMITGSASTMLVILGVTSQISPPTVLLGSFDISPSEALAIDFETQSGKIEFNIGLNM